MSKHAWMVDVVFDRVGRDRPRNISVFVYSAGADHGLQPNIRHNTETGDCEVQMRDGWAAYGFSVPRPQKTYADTWCEPMRGWGVRI